MRGCVKKNRNAGMVCAGKKGKVKCRLHPLIHTLPLAYLTQDMVAGFQDQKCGLKYVIHTLAFAELPA